jgi:hypothetical protein
MTQPPEPRWEQPINHAAEALDALAGRRPTENPSVRPADIQDLDAGDILPRSIRDHHLVRTTHQHISLGGAWIALVAIFGGGGTFAGVVAPAVQSTASRATIGAYLDFGTALLATFAMAAAIAVTVFAFRSGTRGIPLAFTFVLTSVAACYLSLFLGLTNPDPGQILNLPSGNPLATVLGHLEIYATFYGAVPFLTGLGIGAISGNLAYRITND